MGFLRGLVEGRIEMGYSWRKIRVGRVLRWEKLEGVSEKVGKGKCISGEWEVVCRG